LLLYIVISPIKEQIDLLRFPKYFHNLKNSRGLKRCLFGVIGLTLSLPSTTKVPYANSLDPDESSSHSASHPNPSCLTLIQHFHLLWATLKHF